MATQSEEKANVKGGLTLLAFAHASRSGCGALPAIARPPLSCSAFKIVLQVFLAPPGWSHCPLPAPTVPWFEMTLAVSPSHPSHDANFSRAESTSARYPVCAQQSAGRGRARTKYLVAWCERLQALCSVLPCMNESDGPSLLRGMNSYYLHFMGEDTEATEKLKLA